MNGNKVVESSLSTWVLRSWEFGWCLGDALDGGNIGLLICSADVAPELPVSMDGDVALAVIIPFSSNSQLLLRTCC